jgi:hypothetical protein
MTGVSVRAEKSRISGWYDEALRMDGAILGDLGIVFYVSFFPVSFGSGGTENLLILSIRKSVPLGGEKQQRHFYLA